MITSLTTPPLYQHTPQAYQSHGLSLLPAPDLAVVVVEAVTISVALPSDLGDEGAVTETEEPLCSDEDWLKALTEHGKTVVVKIWREKLDC